VSIMQTEEAVTVNDGQQSDTTEEQKPETKPERPLQVMFPHHPDWNEFLDLLFESLGGRIPGNCDGSVDKAVAILDKFRGIDVQASIDYLSNHGGYCDCEILVNVDQRMLDAFKSACSAD